MSGELIIDQIENSAGTFTWELDRDDNGLNIELGLIRCFATIDLFTGGAINPGVKQYNVASWTDVGVGQASFTYTSGFSSANATFGHYASHRTAAPQGNGGSGTAFEASGTQTLSTWVPDGTRGDAEATCMILGVLP